MQGLSFQDDEADEQLNKEYTEQFNFGGGLFERKADSTGPDADPDMRRSKKEVYHQILVTFLRQGPVMCCNTQLLLQHIEQCSGIMPRSSPSTHKPSNRL